MANERLNKLRLLMDERQIPAFLVTHLVNVRYLTGFTGSAGFVVVTPKDAVFFTDFRYLEQANDQVKGFDIYDHGADSIAALLPYVQAGGNTDLYFEEAQMTYAQYRRFAEGLQSASVSFLPVTAIVESLRAIKDEGELAIMKEAGALADRTFEHILQIVKPGMKERDVALELEFYMRHHGATSSSFDIIVASGERSALPHGVAGERVLRDGEFVKFDFGALYQGYCSDLTRTICLGRPSERHREIYDIVLEAQMHALANIRPGMTGREADALARDVISRYGYADQFGHSTGHGLGMEIHEDPRLSKTSDTVLTTGMTVTIEPGIYLPGFGGVRIEDDVVLTASGAERLTHARKELIIID